MSSGAAADPDSLLFAAYKTAQTAADGGDPRAVCEAAASSIISLTKAAGAAVHRAGETRDLLCLAARNQNIRHQIEAITGASRDCRRRYCFQPLEKCLQPDAEGRLRADGPVTAQACLPFELGPDRPMVMRLFFTARNLPRTAELESVCRNIQLLFDIAQVCMRQRRCLQAIDRAGARITSGQTAAEIVKATVDHVTAALNARGSIFWILDVDARQVVTCLSSGFAYQSLLKVDYPALNKIFAFEALKPVVIEDARYDPRIPNLERFGKKRVVALAGFPVAIGRTYLGLLAIYFGGRRSLASHEQEFVASMAQQASMALRATLYDLQDGTDTLRRTVAGMAAAIKAKDDLTHAHSLRVARLARWTAEAMGLSADQAQTIHHAGLLHDIGKIGITDQVLASLGCLDKRQMRQLRRHPEIGADILSRLPGTEKLVPLVKHHHERYDGKGYPDGLKGDAIPLGARILAVCDALETMIHGRPNMPACSLSRSLEQLGAGAGTRFDPRVVSTVTAGLENNPGLAGRGPATAGRAAGPDRNKKQKPGRPWFDLPPSF